MIINDYLKALGQMGDPRFLKVLAMGVGLTIAALFTFTVVFAWVVGLIVPDTFTLWWVGEITWIDNALSWAVIPLMLVLSVFLMVPVASAVIGFFLDEVADAVESQHYPNQPAVSRVSFSETMADSARFLGLLIGVNLLAIPLYLIFAPFAPLIFWCANGLLLGREYATLVAQRRLGSEGARDFRKRHTTTIWAAGTLMAIPLSVPILNLLVPIIGVAGFTHLFHRLNRA